MTARLGLALPPDPVFLELAREPIENDADFFEITPETLWAEGALPIPEHASIRELVQRSGKPVVGHGVDLSLGAAADDDRLELWLEGIRREHAVFDFQWYSEHLGFVDHAGRNAALPLPLPPTDEAVRAVAARIARLREIVPDVAFENQAGYFVLGDPLEEPAFLNAVCRDAACGLLLDLHNVHTQCTNLGVPTDEYLAGIDLANVIEIHVSGGSFSDPAWLESGRVFRLDSHDGPVPDPVWEALEWALPRCDNLRGVVLERMEGTLTRDDVAAYEADVRRLRELLC